MRVQPNFLFLLIYSQFLCLPSLAHLPTYSKHLSHSKPPYLKAKKIGYHWRPYLWALDYFSLTLIYSQFLCLPSFFLYRAMLQLVMAHLLTYSKYLSHTQPPYLKAKKIGYHWRPYLWALDYFSLTLIYSQFLCLPSFFLYRAMLQLVMAHLLSGLRWMV